MSEPLHNEAVRMHLARTLAADLIGPLDGAAESQEVLPYAPLRWYLTGFLAPQDAPAVPPEEDDDAEGAGDDDDDGEMAAQEAVQKAPKRLPSSLGLSVLVPAAGGPDTITARLRYAEYVSRPARAAVSGGAEEGAAAPGVKAPRGTPWQRVPAPEVVVALPLDDAALQKGEEVAPGIWLKGHLRPALAKGLPPGARAVSVFVVNQRAVGGKLDAACVFQVELALHHPAGLLPRSNRRDEGSSDEDEQIADLQFRHASEWAVGHGVSARVDTDAEGQRVARTCWLPLSRVPQVMTQELAAVETGMEALATLAEGDGAALGPALAALCPAYRAWIAAQRAVALDTDPRRETRDTLMYRAELACDRIQAGIDLLQRDAQARLAFALANRAMAQAARQRSPARYQGGAAPRWRLFQLAFVLLNLPGMVDDGHRDRELVELIFFPTGGGKTEAYLGVIAFTLLVRRLQGAGRPDGGLGVAVLLRYTLRLLTLDQLGRAATLICALDLLRQKDPARLGTARFAIGLWVGRSASANTMDQVTDQVRDYRARRTQNSPFPLPRCPWCDHEIAPESIEVLPTKDPQRTRVGCADHRCPFSAARNPEGLPVLFVDEHIYRELPCFLVATVDKFALLPWRGRTAMLFGKVHSRRDGVFCSVLDGAPVKGATALPQGLRPPELIVQDELHLISGPLGTMVGLYETAIAALCTREEGGKQRPPKIIASTATVRRAEQQVRALFGRPHLQMFPPQGCEDSETFFATVDRAGPGRLYLGVAAPGRAMKAVLIRVYVALLGGAQRCYQSGDAALADAYMTLVGYFNSLRELGGMRRLLEDEIHGRCNKDPRGRLPLGQTGEHPFLLQRVIKYEPAELTSRESTASIAKTKALLSLGHAHKDHIDVVLASNMISVGVDIDRLGLMVVAGQPKTTSEYIQSSSRVGRDARWPGLVVTVFNLFKARDRSHYERFSAYHDCFYRFVEATSVTPFSAPALERGLSGVLVALTRLAEGTLTPPAAARAIAGGRAAAEQAIALIARKAAESDREFSPKDAHQVEEEVTRLCTNLLDAWVTLAQGGDEPAIERYSALEPGKGRPLLYTVLDGDRPDAGQQRAKFKAPTSMRDVEGSVHLWKLKGRLIPQTDDEEETRG